MNKYIVSAIMAMTLATGASAQQDLNAEELKGLELDYMNDMSSGKVYVYTDLTYWNLFGVRLHGWNGGSGASSVLLPGGRTLWTFGDSFFGIVSENRNRKKYNMPHSAAMVQSGEASQDDFITLNEYVSTQRTLKNNYTYWGKAWVRHPEATLDQAQIDKGKIDADHYYRPEDGVVVNGGEGYPMLQMLLAGYDADNNRNETSLALFSLEGAPGDATYMKLVDLRRNIVDYSASYGTSVLEDGGRIYLYGNVQSSGVWGNTCYPVVARTQNRSLDSPWEYYVKNSDNKWVWQSTVPTDAELKRSGISSGQWCEHPSVFKYGEKYYMCMFEKVNSSLYIMEASQPYGPFMHRKRLCTMPSNQADMMRLMVHPQLSRMGELVVSYNMVPAATTVITKGADGMAVVTPVAGPARNYNAWESADLQQQHFLRIFGWQTLYGVENIGPIKDAGMEQYTTAISSTTADMSQHQLSVSPLQATTSVDIRHDGRFAWTIASATGAVVSSGEAIGVAHVDVSTLPKGVYIVSAGTESCKIVKR